jgi:hypothetical protein
MGRHRMELLLFKVYDDIPGYTCLSGDQTIELEAGIHLKIETSPNGEELLDAIVPAGKVWEISVKIVVKETNA